MFTISLPICVGWTNGSSPSFLTFSRRGFAIKFRNIISGCSLDAHPTRHSYEPAREIDTHLILSKPAKFPTKNHKFKRHSYHCQSLRAFDSVLLLAYIRGRCLARLLNIAIQIHSFFLFKKLISHHKYQVNASRCLLFDATNCLCFNITHVCDAASSSALV